MELVPSYHSFIAGKALAVGVRVLFCVPGAGARFCDPRRTGEVWMGPFQVFEKGRSVRF